MTASKSSVPPATLTIRRVIVPVSEVFRLLPTDITPLPLLLVDSLVKYAILEAPSSVVVVDPSPSATECAKAAFALVPKAIALDAVACADVPMAAEL